VNSRSKTGDRDHLESASLYVVRALSANETSAFETHLATCSECRAEIEALRPVIDSFVCWPTDVLRPSVSLWERLSRRVCDESGVEPISLPPRLQTRPKWEEVAKGLSCKTLSVDANRSRVTMLVRLAPGTDYPRHRHDDREELHLLHGELWVDDKKLHAGDFIRAEAGSVDHRVWSQTGCTCVLVTSLNDTLL
jgi:quercetin dioxygenase-like cupin family protein